MTTPKKCKGKKGKALTKCILDVNGSAIEVIDTINDDRTVNHIRADNKAYERFNNYLKRYYYPRYVVQVLDIDGDIISDNQGIDGKVRVFD